MATRKKRLRRPADTYEHLYFHIESSSRSYHFGINRANRKLLPEHFSEFDYVEIFGSVREKIDRPIQHVRLHISPAEVPRDQLNPEAQAIGSVETRKRVMLIGWAMVPAESYYSLADALGRGEFKQLTVSIKNMKRGRATIDGMALDAELSEL